MSGTRFRRVLVANRGAVAARVIRALDALGIESVAAYSDADRELPYLADATRAVALGPADARASYLNVAAILAAARAAGADAIHPGYGFLSENAGFAQAVIDAGLAFIGPSPRWIEAMGHKTRARALMATHGMPMAPASGLVHGPGEALAAAERIGYPVLVKPAGGGGGIGMHPAADAASLAAAFERAGSQAARSFGSGEVYLERLLVEPRHIEFQLLGDRAGNVMHLFERDCSIQRRHQKVIEEGPAPGLSRERIGAMSARVATIAGELGYDNIGTVETLHSAATGFGFLEMNTRLQVEHAVTEAITGIDLVQAQVRLAAGEPLASIVAAAPVISGHAIEVRVYAEDPKRFFPSPGKLTTFRPPGGADVRVDTGYAEGCTVTPHYDPLVAKVIVHAPTRERAIARMREALAAFAVAGIKTNIPFAQAMLASAPFQAGAVHTGLAAGVAAAL